MVSLTEILDEQLAFNGRKNLYHVGEHLAFTPRMRALVERRDLAAAMVGRYGKDRLIDYTVDRVLRDLYHAYQYIDVRGADRADLRELYGTLLEEVLAGALPSDAIARRHYERLATWLARTNPITRAINTPEMPAIADIVCAEYSAPLQLRILGLDPSAITPPLLDVGCGEGARLVRWLRERGVEAYGIDRMIDRAEPFLIAANWFEHTFEPGRWGTIISNLSFSSHFLNHHLRGDGKHALFAAKYMEILRSLAPGGRWHYAPSIPFIEDILPAERYRVRREGIDGEFMRSVVERM